KRSCVIEERHGFPGALRTLGGLGGHVGAPSFTTKWCDRGAPRVSRGAPNVGGSGGPCRGPPASIARPAPALGVALGVDAQRPQREQPDDEGEGPPGPAREEPAP